MKKIFYLSIISLAISCTGCNNKKNNEQPKEEEFVPEVINFEKIKNFNFAQWKNLGRRNRVEIVQDSGVIYVKRYRNS